jgi:hypothetical protein
LDNFLDDLASLKKRPIEDICEVVQDVLQQVIQVSLRKFEKEAAQLVFEGSGWLQHLSQPA